MVSLVVNLSQKLVVRFKNNHMLYPIHPNPNDKLFSFISISSN